MEEASLRRVLEVVRARWLVVAALAAVVLTVSWGYAATLPPAHTATVVLSFAPPQGADPGPAFVRLIPRYEIAATTYDALARAEREAGLPSGSLGDAVSVELPDDSLELTLTVTTQSEDASVAAASFLAEIISTTAEDDPLVSVWVAREPESTGSETRQRRAIAMAAGLLLAPVPGVVAALALEGSRPRIRLPEDLAAAGAPVLVSVPLRDVLAGPAAAPAHPHNGALRRDALDDPAIDVVVTSLDEHDDAERAISVLNRDAERIEPYLCSGQARAEFRAAPRLSLAIGAPQQGGWQDRPCVLVVRSGLPQDLAHAAVDLVKHRGGRVLGSVLLTR